LTGLARNVECLVGEIGDPRGECESQEMAQRKDVIGEPGGISVVLFDPQIGFVVEEAVEHMGCVADGRADDLGVERGVLIGDVRVEKHARIVTVLSVSVSAGFAMTAGAKALAVGR
jgi:hypothetical protein